MKQLLKKKTFRMGMLLLLIVTVVNVAFSLAPHSVRFPDTSGEDTFSLSGTTLRYLSGVSQKVEIIYNVAGGRSSADRDIYAFLLQFESASKLIDVKINDVNREDTAAAAQTVTVRSGNRSRTVSIADLYYYYNTAMGIPMTLEEYAAILQSYSASDLDEETYQTLLSYYGPSVMQIYFTGDANVTAAIRFVLAEEAPLLQVYCNGDAQLSLLLRQELEQTGYEVKALSNMTALNGDVLWLNLSKDLTESEAEALAQYLSLGGKVILSTSYAAYEIPKLSAVLAGYGLSAPQELNVVYDVMDSSYSTVFYASAGIHPITDRLTSRFVANTAHSLQVTEVEGVTQTVLLRSSGSGLLRTMNQTEEDEIPSGSFILSVLAEKGESAVLWMSMQPDSSANAYSGNINDRFVEEALSFFTGYDQSALSISYRAVASSYLETTTLTLIVWVLMLVLLIPAAVMTVGIVRYYVRKKRSA